MDLKVQLTRLENQKADLLIAGYLPTDQKIVRVEQTVNSIKNKMGEVTRDLLEEEGIMNPLVEIKDLLQKSLYLAVDRIVAETRKEALKREREEKRMKKEKEQQNKVDD